jgi:hypothetical protein
MSKAAWARLPSESRECDRGAQRLGSTTVMFAGVHVRPAIDLLLLTL